MFHIQKIVEAVPKTILTRQDYCVVLDPVDSKGQNQLGKKELRKGVCSFFLHPGTSTHMIDHSHPLGLWWFVAQ